MATEGAELIQNFEAAVLFLSNSEESTLEAAEAVHFLAATAASPDVWALCLDRFLNSSHVEVCQ